MVTFVLMIHNRRLHTYALAVVASCLLLAAPMRVHAIYVDHRGHNIDSLEVVLAGHPSFEVEVDTRVQLMVAYQASDMKKSLQHAHALIHMTDKTDLYVPCADAFRMIGQHFYACELYDSAACYFTKAIAKIKLIQPKEGSIEPDNMLSATYGALGNLMNIQDSVRQAEAYYRQALEIFERRQWNESVSLCFYNMGEMYVSMDDSLFHALGYEGSAAGYAMEMYRRGKDAALLTNDSFFVAGLDYGIAKSLYYSGDCEAALPLNTEILGYLEQHKDDNQQTYLDALQLQSSLLIRTGDITGADRILKILSHEEKKDYREKCQKLVSDGDKVFDGELKGHEKLWIPLLIVGVLFLALVAWLLSRGRTRAEHRETKTVEGKPMAQGIEANGSSEEGKFFEPSEVLELASMAALEPNGAPEPGENVEEAVVSGDIVLSEREVMVIRLLGEGKTTPQIAAAIYRSTDTVRWYRKRLLQKFDVHNTAALIKAASERGIL